MEDMRAKLNTGEGTEQYQKRMFTVEPVFGQMKQDRGFREFLLRGKIKTKIEFSMKNLKHSEVFHASCMCQRLMSVSYDVHSAQHKENSRFHEEKR